MHYLSHFRRLIAPAALLSLMLLPAVLHADDDDDDRKPGSSVAATDDSRYGPFGLLDRRSKYTGDWFPEPFRVEDTTLNNELRFDWEHGEAKGIVNNTVTAEVQKSVAGIVTLEMRVGYLNNTSSMFDGTEIDRERGEGVVNVELAARCPLYQVVSKSGDIDNSIGVNFEIGIPTNSRVSKNTEIAPGIFDDLRIGDHFSLQSLFTFSSQLGSRPEDARDTFEYGLALGYAIEDEEFSLPHVERTTPIVELVGETQLDGSHPGHNSLTGTAGIRLEFKSIMNLQPTFGVGYIFPIDQGGRQDLRWGVFTSLIFDF